jgi:hypothetical protein
MIGLRTGKEEVQVSPSAAPGTQVALAMDPMSPPVSSYWVGPLVALGSLSARYSRTHPDRQLIVVISVPQRDYAAVLIACGWVMSRPGRALPSPMEVLSQASQGSVLRVVTEREVILDRLLRVDEQADPPRLYLTTSRWLLPAIRELQVVEGVEIEQAIRMARPEPGALGRLSHIAEDWNARLATSICDLALVGTGAWLRNDLDACLHIVGRSRANESKELSKSLEDSVSRGKPYKVAVGHGSLLDVVLPEMHDSSASFSRIYSSARFAEHLPLPASIRAAVLDGSGAIKYLAEIETPLVICVLDRSVADEASAELVVQMRNTRGEPVAVKDLGWRPPPGVEAMAFTVAP